MIMIWLLTNGISFRAVVEGTVAFITRHNDQTALGIRVVFSPRSDAASIGARTKCDQ